MVELAIVIPTRNRTRSLQRLLLSLEEQRRQKREEFEVEVVVVEDGGTNHARRVCAEDINVVRLSGLGPAAARNAGVASVNGADYFLFLDDDCFVAPDFLDKIRLDLSGSSAGILVPAIRSHCSTGAGWIAKYLQWRGFQQPVVGEGGAIMCVPSAALVVRRRDFIDAGGFPEEIRWPGGEDDVFFRRAVANGTSVKLCPESIVFHDDPATISEVVRRWYLYGKGHAAAATILRLPPQVYDLPEMDLARRRSAVAILVDSIRSPAWRQYRSRIRVGLVRTFAYMIVDLLLEVARQRGAARLMSTFALRSPPREAQEEGVGRW